MLDEIFKFKVGQEVFLNHPFEKTPPRFFVISRCLNDKGTFECDKSYHVRQVFEHIEYERREGISIQPIVIYEHELSPTPCFFGKK